MSGLALYQIASEYRSDLEKLADLDLDPQTLKDTIEGMSGDLETKATNCAYYYRNRLALIDAMKSANKDLAARIKTEEGKNDRFLESLKKTMEFCGITKIEGPQLKLTIKANPGSMVIDDEKLIPSFFWKAPPPPPPSTALVLDKDALKEALKTGEVIPGAKLEKGSRLEIK